MPYCLAYGCSTSSVRNFDLSFFSFPLKQPVVLNIGFTIAGTFAV